MKRKVKFQEGGAVEQPATDSRQRARDRARARRRAATQREIDRLNPGQTAGEAERRAGRGVPERAPDFSTDERGTTRRGAATGREVVPAREVTPTRPSASRALTEVATPRQMPLGRVRPPVGGNLAALGGSVAMGLAEPLVNYGRRNAERYAAESDARREANLRAFRNYDRSEMEQEMGEAAQRMPTPRPRPAARPAPVQPRIREMSADELNEMELRRIRAERQMEEDEARRIRMMRQQEEEVGGSGNIGAASARERGEQVGPPGQYNMKKGGKVPAPKKMMKGGIVAKPKSKAKPKGKPMPFKKGGKIVMQGKK